MFSVEISECEQAVLNAINTLDTTSTLLQEDFQDLAECVVTKRYYGSRSQHKIIKYWNTLNFDDERKYLMFLLNWQ